MSRLSRIVTLVLAAAAAPGWAQELPPPDDPSQGLPPEAIYTETIIARGDKWRLVEASGYAPDDGSGYFNRRLYMIQDADGVRSAPLPAGVRADLLRLVTEDSSAFTLSQEIVDEIAASEAAGRLSPALQAIAEPMDDGEPVDVFGNPRGATALRLFGKCKDKVVNKTKTFDVRTPITRSFDIGDGFSGTIALSGNAQGTGTGEIQIRLKRYAVFGACIPYGVRFDHVRAFGNVTANYGATLSGTVTYVSPNPADPGSRKAWEWQIAKPHLFYYGFFIGPIPVTGGFNLPITAGLELNASITASRFWVAIDDQPANPWN